MNKELIWLDLNTRLNTNLSRFTWVIFVQIQSFLLILLQVIKLTHLSGMEHQTNRAFNNPTWWVFDVDDRSIKSLL